MTSATGTAGTSFGYAGEYADSDTGLVYLRARYYDPATGQFLTRDPLVGQTREAYGYVNGNPLNATDPTGHNKCELGANPLRWGGNAQDCVAGNSIKHDLSVVSTAAAAVAVVALVAVTLPVTVPGAAGVLATASVVSTVATAGHGVIECTDGGSGGACATDGIGAGLGAASLLKPSLLLNTASNGYGLAAATLGPISGPSTAPDVTAPVGRVGC